MLRPGDRGSGRTAGGYAILPSCVACLRPRARDLHHVLAGCGRAFHVFSGQQPKLEMLRRVSSLAVQDRPPLDSTVVCIPVSAVAAIAAAVHVRFKCAI
jgi:hypothetical protein|eukprot:COSAG01_NODE_3441_length_6094_cov_16.295079_9_plen_99_part_00